jgi:hypothetical protein
MMAGWRCAPARVTTIAYGKNGDNAKPDLNEAEEQHGRGVDGFRQE